MKSTRARSLAEVYPAAAGPLLFFAELADLQQSIPAMDSFDVEAAADALPPFLTSLAQIAPPPIVDAARELLREGHDKWKHLLHTYWTGERDIDPRRAFIAEAFLQPLAENCLSCRDTPVVAVLRDKAHGSERSFVCGFCLKEWTAPRISCPSCGEERFEKLAVFRAEEFPAARIDACETCRSYIKTIDLTKDGNAIPVVDDIATLTLDVWAREQGYQRLRPNLLRL